jgi:hypothetical protein
MTTFRKYTVQYPFADWLELVLRPLVMEGSPVDGCTSTDECTAIYEGMKWDDELAEAAGVRPQAAPELPDLAFSCEPDPYGGMGALPRCLVTCTTNDECTAGSICDKTYGRCVLGPIPTPECVSTLQAYEVRAGDAFTVIGDVSGYRHRVVVASDGACVVDETKSPLLTNRFHRSEPACTSLAPDAVSPNPCIVEDWLEPVVVGIETGVPDGDVDDELLQTRPSRIVRIRMPGFTLDVTDVAVPITYDDPAIAADQWYSRIPSTFAFGFPTAGGLIPQIPAPMSAHLPQYIVVGPDGLPWIIDTGEGNGVNGTTRGQLVGLSSGPQGFIWIF